MLRKFIILMALLATTISNVWAAIENPVNMLNNTIVKTQDKLIKNATEYKQDPYKLLGLVDKEIIPIVAPKVVAQLVVGTEKWKKATAQEQKDFIHSATEMLTFMYAKNVAYAGKYKIRLFPFNQDDNSWQKKAIVVVNGKITNIDNNQSSDFAVKMFQKEGKWHIYDFDVAGVSILKAYQEQFAPYATVPEMTKAAERVTTNIKKKNYPKLLDDNYKLQNVE
ncbi:ABC transporter substrate-binding protein [Allofrancisella guangzhouensis]|uniref:Membrane protein n=1 Tax=Allofrancisella guangzhouensis TaxID=594679 RepID=A0A0A8E3S7_9GAMM|nr:ABC transporter substrate-binding protein [Allofrancisella guangzhouensis]AJC48277.1 membrane protein [Allofrancisella guangzhouensis]MBK2026637.1 ABC transporter substrate-binding protein [Allofrancisella guangzhouensis]MBK2043424.1 ABC transporter substrate-binding protein [Allofrancisella guangzhouensis]MBK2045624.1 ABC transporter substrate-binding protein [Allofrancisella guangzhouensis]